MVSQSAAATSPSRQSASRHFHTDHEVCPWCQRVIPPEQLEEISGKIAAKERQQALAITTKLEQQHAADKAQADAKAKADLELERQQSAARETAARDEAKILAEAAAAEKLADAERSRQAVQAELQQQVAAADAARMVAEHAGASLQAQLENLQRIKDAEVAKAKEDAAAEALRAHQEATEAAESAMRDRIVEKDQVIAEAQARRAEIESKLAALTEQQELTLKQQLDAQREILEKDKDAAISAEKAKAFEETQKLQNKLSDMQRTIDKKTADELGEGAEIDLYEALREEFPEDRIDRIVRGEPGADIHHVVLHNGRECGTIIYDSKNHKAFRNDHVAKLARDQIAARAEHAILSTHKFPQGTRQLHMQDGVLLANPARVVAVVVLIRQHMLQTHTLRMSNASRAEKTAKLYAFITSERCSQLLGRIDTHADELLEHQVKEKKWHEASWKKQGEAYRSIQKAKADLDSEIGCIIGTATEEDLELEEIQR